MNITANKKRAFLASLLVCFALLSGVSSFAQQGTVKTSKKVYAKTDTIVFYYKYSGNWESTWLVVDPIKGKNGLVTGDHMTTAADLYGNPATRKFFGRFSPGTYKAVLWGNFDNGKFQKQLASCSFEIKPK
jgi:hypothetical protein